MGQTTGIGWTDATHNFWYGCKKVSQGCKLCYAEREMTRYGKDFSVVTRAKGFDAPLRWKEPRKVFVNSWSDFFIEEADQWRPLAWEIISQTPHLTYQILTKRPERLHDHLPWHDPDETLGDTMPWEHVWLGVSVENQATADERIPWLLSVPAAIRFVSYEPALGPVDFRPYLPNPLWNDLPSWKQPALDWIICGGESGAGARACEVAWLEMVVEQCNASGVACFVKQLGAHPHAWNRDRTGMYEVEQRDRKGADPTEWPEGLRVQQFPHLLSWV